MKLTKLFNDFFESEKGGVLLIACTIISLLLANSSISEFYLNFWHFDFAGLSIENWINEGLMAIFFFSHWPRTKTRNFSWRISQCKKRNAAGVCSRWGHDNSRGHLHHI
jgi:Na+/H+ antiporter NhaA